MTPLFLDSGFLIALEAGDDQHHEAARAFWRAFEESPAPLVTTSFILDEVATFFNRRGHHAKSGRNRALFVSQPVRAVSACR